MPSSVEELNPTRVKLTIEIPFADLQPSIEKAYREIATQVRVPGFRKGKVPRRLIDDRFGRGAVLQDAINEIIPQAYSGALAEHEITPLGRPDVEVTKLEDGELVEFTAEVDIRPEFELPDFSTLEIQVDPVAVSDTDLDERVDTLRSRFATYTDLDTPAADDLIVTIDLAGTQNGEPIPDADAHGMTYRVGAGGMVDGLDDALRGLSAGESATFESKLLGGPHKGEPAEITVSVSKVQSRELPEVNDDFAQLVSEYDTAAEMLAGLRESMERVARIDQANQVRDRALDQVLELVSFDLPEQLIESETEARKQEITDQLAQIGLTLEDYLATTEETEAKTPDEFWADQATRQAKGIRAQVILDKVADVETVPVTQQDLTQLIIQKAQENGTSPQDEANHMMEHNHLSEWMGEVRRGKALGLIVERAKVSDTEGQVIDLSHLRDDGTVATDEELAAEQAAAAADADADAE